MWPALFGSGWIWGALIAGTLACFVVGVLGFLFLITGKPPRQSADELETAWHRFEEGDLTRSEFERTVQRGAASRRPRTIGQ
jgi:hypothetical protein